MSEPGPNFIRAIIEDDLDSGKHAQIVTRFPPHPNGFLHIGHAKSICLNFGVARDFDGHCNLRFDDSNPLKEKQEYLDAICEDVSWLGFTWAKKCHASDYFHQLYQYAEQLIEKGLAYVDSQTAQAMRETRGTLTEPGINSPYRDREPADNLLLFREMRDGKHADGEHVLRAKIDMASGNINLRDPVLYRIRHENHHQTGDKWCIYPMYDFTHTLSDALEGITHSLCTLEFEDHRPLYEWFLEHLDTPSNPRQIEFARLHLEHTIVSKRKLQQLVSEGVVSGWDDPRMPTLSGMRRRGYTPAAIREFCDRIGVTKKNATVEMGVLEDALRQDLNDKAPRRMGVLRPLKVVIENYPEDREETLPVANHPGDESFGTREVPFSREIWIEQADFMEDPPKKFYRLGPGREVRLRSAYYITCNDVIYDDDGQVVELRCSYDPESRGGGTPDGRKVKGTMHWVSARHGKQAEIRLFDRLFDVAAPGADGDFMDDLNPESLEIISDAIVEPSVAELSPEQTVQFERTGYFCPDRNDHSTEHPVLNRAVSLRDSWKGR